jgi:hypothetical protein
MRSQLQTVTDTYEQTSWGVNRKRAPKAESWIGDPWQLLKVRWLNPAFPRYAREVGRRLKRLMR